MSLNLERPQPLQLEMGSEQHKDSNRIFLRDIKTFVGLKKVAKDHNHRKLKYHLNSGGSATREDLLVSQQVGKSQSKVLYVDQVAEASDRVNKEINQRLMGVLQSLDTKDFYRIVDETGRRENQQQFTSRINNQITMHMNNIDSTYKEIEQVEKQQAFARRQRVEVSRPVAKKSGLQSHS